jgi:hypothetical protein
VAGLDSLPKDPDAFWRKLILPEEDRRLLPGYKWAGGYRWFRSPNVIPIERAREARKKAQASKPD